MNWETLRRQLERILDASFKIKRFPLNNDEQFDAILFDDIQSIIYDDDIYFVLDKNDDAADVLSVNAALITPSERQLIQLMVEAYRHGTISEQALLNGSRSEREIGQLSTWLLEQIDEGHVEQELPAMFAKQSNLYVEKIPLLLYGEYPDHKKVSYGELQKLLQSFFEVETLLIPLRDKEWLILCSNTLLADDENEEESPEEALASICLGLYGMMVSEGIGECHLSIHYPIIPATSLLPTVLQLRETIDIGKMFHQGSNIHLPWELQLERIVHLLPDAERRNILSNIMKQGKEQLDPEILLTLEEFFAMDGNLGETAKKLYIHRNTLTYRLDRFKQQSGLDVRLFNDALLARIGLLLYKVTK